jgi:hypothetical protein
MVLRKQYLDRLIRLRDKKIIKVVTGVRRCGKSTLLKQFEQYLLENGVVKDQIISINFEDISFDYLLEYHALYQYITERLLAERKTYIFLDEIQAVSDFQKAVDSLFLKDNVDIYITGSNAHMLSGELATLLSGRYVEVPMLPLSFSEYAELVGGDVRSAWKKYFTTGGFPYASQIEDEEIRRDYLDGIYHTVLLKDVAARRRINDIELLESIVKFLFDNVGNMVSSKKIADSLTSFGRKTTSLTAENYVTALCEAFILYKVGRYDVQGKQHLKSLEKYYIVDVGLRSLLIGNRNRDIGHILENIVYLELARKGYHVSVGKLGELEIDFVAEKDGEKAYYQVAATVLSEDTFAREIAPLKKIHDNYPKFIVTMDEIPMDEDGIKVINVVDFLTK